MTLDHLSTDLRFGPGVAPTLLVRLPGQAAAETPLPIVVVGIDEAGILPETDPSRYDILLTTALDPPAPWVNVKPGDIVRIEEAVERQPTAAIMLAQQLRLNERLSFADAVAAESLAYSTLLGSEGFRAWLSGRADKQPQQPATASIQTEREGDEITITLADSANRNAMSAQMRDALWEALACVCDDPSRPNVLIQAAGDCFSIGGALHEFGTASDLAMAHRIRMARSPTILINELGSRCKVELHGACIGSGIEIPATAHTRVARANAWFQLPELSMGLIPGAGGTVSMSRAIGRHRLFWMVLTGRRINAMTALKWGLIHSITA